MQAGADVYSFDARNRLTSGPEGAYSYSPRGTLVSVVGAETHTYGFDSLDRLVAFDGVNYTYDGLGRVASRGADTFAYTGFSLDPSSDGEYVYGRSPGGSLLSISDGSETVLVGRDRHGDVTHLFDASGSVEFSSLYDPFGDVTTTAGTQVGSVGFQGDWTDPESEHVWMGARWYDGGWATFLSRDTVFGELSTSVSLNRYTYAYNNPLSFWDPDGRCPDYLKSVNGGAAWEQCRGFQDELGRRGTLLMLAQKKVQERVNSWFGKTNESPEPASAEAQEAPGTPGHLMYNPMCDCTTWVPDRSFGDRMKRDATTLGNIGLAFLDDWVLKPVEVLAQGVGGVTVTFPTWVVTGEWLGIPDFDWTVGPVDFFGSEYTRRAAERGYENGGVLSTVTSVVVGAKAAWKGAKWLNSAIRSRKVPTGLVDDAARLTTKADDVADAASFADARSIELQSALPSGSQGRVTLSAGIVEDAAGNRITVIATSEPAGYLRPGVRDMLKPGEVVIGGTGHAEADIVAWASANGYRVVAVGSGRPHCAACVEAITGAGGVPASSVR